MQFTVEIRRSGYQYTATATDGQGGVIGIAQGNDHVEVLRSLAVSLSHIKQRIVNEG